MAHTCNPTLGRWELEDHEFKANLSYLGNSTWACSMRPWLQNRQTERQTDKKRSKQTRVKIVRNIRFSQSKAPVASPLSQPMAPVDQPTLTVQGPECASLMTISCWVFCDSPRIKVTRSNLAWNILKKHLLSDSSWMVLQSVKNWKKLRFTRVLAGHMDCTVLFCVHWGSSSAGICRACGWGCVPSLMIQYWPQILRHSQRRCLGMGVQHWCGLFCIGHQTCPCYMLYLQPPDEAVLWFCIVV